MTRHSPFPITERANPSAGAVAAILLTADTQYVLQLRDDKPGIWDPGSWGCFGGSVDAGELVEKALRRELAEELELYPAGSFNYFTQVAWDYSIWGHGTKLRYYFEVRLSDSDMKSAVLHEGQACRCFTADEVLREPFLTAYDSHALRMHIRCGLPR